MTDTTLPTARRATVQRYFAAMRQGGAAAGDLLALFTNDAVYEEPFTGPDDPAVGIDAIRERLQQGWEQPLAAMELDVLSIEVTGREAITRWECRSPDLPGGVVRGRDVVSFRGDRIERLVVTLEP